MKKFLLLILFLLAGSLAEAGSVQFSTYYPSPFGMYDRLRLVPRAELIPPPPCDPGTFYYQTGAGLKLCDETATWGPFGGGVWTQLGDNIYPADTASNPNLNVGIGTATPRTKLELGNDGAILATGTFGSGWSEPDLGAGTRLLWYPRKAAFRAGYVNGSQWNNINVGNYSVAMGSVTTASGLESTAMGASTTASGIISTAMGSSTTASGLESTAMGRSTTASGSGSTAMGGSTTASGYDSTAIGFYTTAQAYASTVLGRYNVIAGNSASWVAADPLFVIGNGASAIAPSNAMTVLKNGNVGIGTTAPTSRLHVKALEGDNPEPGIFLDDTDITVDGGSDGIFGLRNKNTGATPRISIGGPGLGAMVMTIDTDVLKQNVGIGTGNPNYRLDIQGGDLSVSNSGGGYIRTWAGHTDLSFNGGIDGVFYLRNDGIDTGRTTFSNSSGQSILSITNTGNVGIGTTDPGTNKLEVVSGPIKATGGFILETRTTNPAVPVDGQMWLCTDTGDATLCNGI